MKTPLKERLRIAMECAAAERAEQNILRERLAKAGCEIQRLHNLGSDQEGHVREAVRKTKDAEVARDNQASLARAARMDAIGCEKEYEGYRRAVKDMFSIAMTAISES